MASSMLTGDRRWAPTRKSGMTVLGKVPKPINLPSQRLENHGLDPNVEIVPKGTLTWGSRPSSAIPNAWGSSTQSSPNTDGSVSSPNRLNGRPSSGGSGTRPSTAGSDKSFEPITNFWASNSRPSSASGILASNQSTMATTRPRSAETRPGSSQLSRFAEPIPENSVPWGGAGTAERLGPTSSKANDFTLSSGDFPTLGSEKNSELHMQQAAANHSSQGRPSSASDKISTQKERLEVSPGGDEVIDIQSDKGNTNTWKRDAPPYGAAGGSPDIDNWHRDPHMAQPYPNLGVPPHHFNPWRGPPVQNPRDGVWYRGAPPAGSYRPLSGNYPVEPYAYYPPQLPARPASNSQTAPRPGAVLGGYPHKNGDSFRPHMPSDSYMVPHAPVISVRPGVYPGPVPYDGYYGQPRPSFPNSSEREASAMGMATGPGIYNQYQNQNLPREPGNFHAWPSGYVRPVGNEQMEGNHTHEIHGGQYRVLLKQHDRSGNDAEEKREHSGVDSTPHLEVANQPAAIRRDGDMGSKGKRDEVALSEGSSCPPVIGSEGFSKVTSAPMFHETSIKDKEMGENQVKKLEPTTTPADPQQYSSKSNATLIEKIEGLNNKARIADGRNEGPVFAKEEKTKRIRSESIKADHSKKMVQPHAIPTEKVPTEKSPERGQASAAHVELRTSVRENSPECSNVKVVSEPSEALQSVVGMPGTFDVGPKAHLHIQNSAHGKHGRTDHHPKSRLNSRDGEECKKQLPRNDSSSVNVMTKVEIRTEVGLSGQASEDLPDKQSLHHTDKVGDEKQVSSLDSIDYRAQRAKMKELALQRAKQLEKEEEERTKEQKAKALAKLEALNRRTLTESSNKVDNVVPSSDASKNKLDSRAHHAPKPDVLTGDSTGFSSGSASDAGIQASENDLCKHVGPNMVQKSGADVAKKGGSIQGETSDPSIGKPGGSTLMQMSDPRNKKPGGESNLVLTCDSGISRSWVPTVAQTSNDVTKPEVTMHSSGDVVQKSSQAFSASVISQDPSLVNDVCAEISSQKTNIQAHEGSVSKQKQMGHRRRQNIQQEKNLGEKAVSPTDTDNPKVREGSSTSGPIADSLANNCNEVGDPSGQHKKRNSRNTRYRNRPDESPLISTLPSVTHAEGILEKPKSSGSTSEVIAITAQTSEETSGGQSSNGALTSSSQEWTQGVEESHRKVINQWKPHPPKRTNRNGQTRPVDKNHGTEAVVWAPVRQSSKSDTAEEVLNAASEQSNYSSAKSGSEINLKFKRAEMERYVPKLVAKDLSQQGNSQQPSFSLHQTAPAEDALNSELCGSVYTNEGEGSSARKSDSAAENKSWDHTRPNKHGKGHASWRQRSGHEGSSSDATKTAQKPADQKQPPKPDSSLNIHPTLSSNDWDAGNNTVLPNEAVVTSAVEKGAPRGKRQMYKVHKVVGTNDPPMDTRDLPTSAADKSDTQFPASGSNESDVKSAFRADNRNVGEHTRPHWKPKSQANHQEGSRCIEGQRVASKSGTSDKAFPLQVADDNQLQDVEDKNNTTPGNPVMEAKSARHYEARRERKLMIGPSRGQIGSSNQEVSHTVEQDPTKVEMQHGHTSSSGPRQHGQHNGRFNKGQEANLEGHFNKGQDISKHNLSANVDRPRHGSQYGYQKMEFHNKPSDPYQQRTAVAEDPKDGFPDAGSNYRERGHSHSRRGGHFFVRNSGPPARTVDLHGSRE